MGYKVQVGVSNKHLHLCEADVETLFGKGHQLTDIKPLSQPGQFACDEKVDIVGPKGTLKGVRVLGPVRPETQVELAATDARAIGVNPPVRESGDLDGTPGVKLIGPAGEVELERGTIIALRHIHLTLEEAEAAGVKDKDIVSVKCEGERGLIFHNVLIRAGSNYAEDFHLDTDESNAAGITTGDKVEIIK